MMVQKGEDLGLSLSLSFPEKRSSDNYSSGSGSVLNLNLMHNHSPFTNNNSNWMANAFPSSDRRMDNGETRSFLKGIDVNRVPCGAEDQDQDQEAGVSSPNSTISSSVISISGKRSTDDEDRPCGNSDEDEDADNARKKLRLSKDQSVVLEETFKEHNTLNPKQKQALAKRLGLRPRQVEVWFQNRRARTKLKQTEVDCEFLKRCCDNLSEENRRLQKEVQELRALKMLSPQMYMQMSPPTTLTMCPSCERVAVPPSASLPSHTRPMPSTAPLSQMRPMATFNSWPAAVPHRPFDALHSRS